MKPSLSLRVSQHLTLTPQLQQSIRLLQLSTLELSQEVEQMLADNPFLDQSGDEADQAERELFGPVNSSAPAVTDDAPGHDSGGEPAAATDPEPTVAAGPEDLDWDGDGTLDFSPDDSEWGVEEKARTSKSDEQEPDTAVALAGDAQTLSEHLWQQACGLHLNPQEKAALRFLIESLNDDGFLEDSLEELAQSLSPENEEEREDLLFHLRLALRHLHQFEPTGVGARSLQECLTLQLMEQPNNDTTRCALELVSLPLEQLARRDTRKLGIASGYDESTTKSALALIASLEPKPARPFARVERNYIVPDVIVTTSGSGTRMKLNLQINPDVMPRLKVNDIYASALRGHKGDSHAGLQQRLTEARWFIKNIQQRFDTILRVSRAIVERQRNFFVHGELAMRPLVLREIADELGLHESTISRVTTAKYMATPLGTFELKYFFGSSLGTETGGNASSTAVRALIKQFIAAEDSRRPLSDNAIAEMLKEQGIDCARRTVAKYREGLRIATASLRKAAA
ncbi:MAG: putative polymerase sigma-54 factor [Pseudomonadota bacterium]|jgi:RNA polymerase sigma-54 factor